MRTRTLALLVVAVLGSCVTAQPAPKPTAECSETPTTSKVVAGYTLWGKGGDVFLVLGVLDRDTKFQDRALHASTPEKMLVVVEHPIIPSTDAERIPNELNVPGRNLSTAVTRMFVVGRDNSALGIGVEWGGNFEFPDAGCWELRLSAPRNADTTIIVKVL